MSKAKTALRIGELALLFGRTNRATFHEDGVTPESDTDHTVMLGLIACAFCPPHLDRGLVAQFVLVHDLVEAYAGDTNTAFISADEREAKERREAQAFEKLRWSFEADAPWIVSGIRNYEAQEIPEARYVRFLDKAMPKITHILNQCTTIKKMDRSREELVAAHDAQFVLLLQQYPEFQNTPLAELMLELMRKAEEHFPGPARDS